MQTPRSRSNVPVPVQDVSQHSARTAILISVLAVSAIATRAQVVFSPPKNVSNSSGNAQNQQIAVDSSGKVNVPWVDTSLGNSEVFLSRSADGSATFSTPLNISNDSGKSLEPQIGVDSSGNISVAWADNTPLCGVRVLRCAFSAPMDAVHS